MKAKFALGIVCASLSVFAVADAAPSMTELQRQAYDRGWDAAHAFCVGQRHYGRHHYGGRRSITTEFKRWCKRGFDEYIDSNRSCGDRIERRATYNEMWSARSDSCS